MSPCDNEKLEKGIVRGLVLAACAPWSGASRRLLLVRKDGDEATTAERVAPYGGDGFQVHEECLHEPTLGITSGREVGKKVVISLAARSPPPAMPSCASVVGLAMTLTI
uniref:Uncharacterized protein n=1 Tax=Oryza nivara TaxID=4536 RepID=A0A0E0GXK5_ORYNI